jgi:hypothetical protein
VLFFLVDAYTVPKSMHTAMGNLYVLEIVHYKSYVRLEHEYLVAMIKGQLGGCQRLQLERSLPPQQEPHHSDIEGLDDGNAGSEGEQLRVEALVDHYRI